MRSPSVRRQTLGTLTKAQIHQARAAFEDAAPSNVSINDCPPPRCAMPASRPSFAALCLVGYPMMLISFLSPGENGANLLVGARTRKSLQSVFTVKVPGRFEAVAAASNQLQARSICDLNSRWASSSRSRGPLKHPGLISNS